MKKIKENLVSIILIIIFIAGLSLLLYPTVASWWNSFHATHAIESQAKLVENLSSEEYSGLLNQAEEYNKGLLNNSGRFHPSEEEIELYNSQLSIDGGSIMGSVEIPSQKIILPVYHGTSEETLSMGAGHLEGSSLPVGGLGTHAVITGHRGLPSARLFTDLDKVVEGDYVIVKTLNEMLTYQVDSILIVLPEEIEKLAIDPNKDQLTLITCTPYGINSHRILITGHRVENLSDIDVVAEASLLDSKIVALFVAIPILIGLFIWLMVYYRKPMK